MYTLQTAQVTDGQITAVLFLTADVYALSHPHCATCGLFSVCVLMSNSHDISGHLYSMLVLHCHNTLASVCHQSCLQVAKLVQQCLAQDSTECMLLSCCCAVAREGGS